jgi:hypothetical protein
VHSEKVLIMPNRLRQDEKPPYPEFAVEMVREFSKTISAEISPMRADVSVMKHAIYSLESQSKIHGQKLEDIVGIKHNISALESASTKQGIKIETIDGHIDKAKGAVWAFGIILTILGGASVILELVKYFAR